MKRRKTISVLILTMAILSICLAGGIIQSYYQSINIQFNVQSDKNNHVQLYYGKETADFNEKNSMHFAVAKKNQKALITAPIRYRDTNYIRIDFDDNVKTKNIISDYNYFKIVNHQKAIFTMKDNITTHNASVKIQGENLIVEASGADPHIVIKLDRSLLKTIMNGNKRYLAMMIIGAIVVINAMFLLSYGILRKNKLFLDLYRHKKLIWNLSKNDFKTKYAGSFFGIFWAFVQPVVTIVLYWFVFQVGLRSGNVGDTPFVLWLIVGLVPWFFFQDVVISGTNCLIEYSYLVKKMVFQIKVLPIVKVMSALFVHLFFIVVTIVIFWLSGYAPSIYYLQLPYYLFCAIILVLGITFATSSIIAFFRDIGQIIQIFMQVFMWMTPIMWNIQIIPASMLWLVQLNPLYYITEGFRDCFINRVWFWNKMDLTLNYWLITIFIFILGNHVYKRLKEHFADVL